LLALRGSGVAFIPFLVRCPIGINCILDLMFPAHLSVGHNYAEFPYFYLKPLVGQYANLATGMYRHPALVNGVCMMGNYR
jgi:hypothetical protein